MAKALNLPIVAEPTVSSVPAPNRPLRAADVRTALRLTYITLIWMTIEGIASIILGFLSQSILLEAFGIDSAIELFSALVLLWRLRVETGGKADEAHIERVERRAARGGHSASERRLRGIYASSIANLPLALVPAKSGKLARR